MDTITGISKIRFVGGKKMLPVDDVFDQSFAIEFLSNNIIANTNIPADQCNKIEIELYFYYGNILSSEIPLFFTSDNSFGIKIDSNKKIQVVIGNTTFTSNFTVWGYASYYIRLTCENGVATLYIFSINRRVGGAYDTVTSSYNTLPFNNQDFCIRGENHSTIRYVRIKKNGHLVYDGIPVISKLSDPVNGKLSAIYNRIDKTHILFSSTEAKSYDTSVGSSTGTYTSCHSAVSIDCKNYKWINGYGKFDGSWGFADSENLVTVTNLNDKIEDLDWAFSQCDSIANITIPTSCKTATGAFKDCKAISSFSFPSSTYALDSVGSGCTNLSTVYIYCPTLGYCSLGLFYNTTKTKYVHVVANSNTYTELVNIGYDDQGTKEGVILVQDL